MNQQRPTRGGPTPRPDTAFRNRNRNPKPQPATPVLGVR